MGSILNATTDIVLPRVHDDQKTLANLSRCSKRLQALAQPVLFHYFHTGIDRMTFAESMRPMLSFLRAIVQKPHLARAVQALAFNDDDGTWTGGTVDSETQMLLREAGERVAFRPLTQYKDADLRWMQEVAIAMTPRLNQLLVYRVTDSRDSRPTHGNFPHLKWSPVTFPNLACLVFAGSYDECYDDGIMYRYHVGDMRHLIDRSPNVEVLLVVDGTYDRLPAATESWKGSLPKLRKLSFNDLNVTFGADAILRGCPTLEELEYCCDPYGAYLLQPESLDIVRSTLRRLSYSIKDFDQPHLYHDVFDAWELDMGHRYGYPALESLGGDDFSFAHFPRLAYLEIQQILFYYVDIDIQTCGCQRFLAKLPPAVQTLRIGAVISWSVMYRDLMGLSEALKDFVYLELIELEGFTEPDTDQIRHLQEMFSANGVTLSVGVVEGYYRGFLGLKPGQDCRRPQ
ncbi:hypothetical protein SLS62_006978 [Diatrype stigma]|uniref:F-box domain-containing protein n=1 Tax=Diatrype stigma TaxID=117547 RepID=A0AAN9V0A7_9PEZI